MGIRTSYGLGVYQAAESSQMWLPHDWQGAANRRVIVWCHGAGAGYALGPVESWLVGSGFPLIATDLGGTRTWGSDTSLTRVTTAWTFAKNNYGVKTDKMILWGGSMGGLTAILYTIANAANVAVCAAAIPAIDPQYVHDNDPGSPANHDAIETVYGSGTVPSGKQAYNQGAAYAATAVPCRIWTSTSDTFTPSASTSTFVSASGCTQTNLGAVGHSYSGIDAGSVASYLKTYA